MSNKIKRRERDAIIKSLQAGVVPRIGLRHIQVGRVDEVSAILRDLNRIDEGGATVRFIIGRYGAGKSFFLSLSRMVALEKKYVVLHADITPDRRLHATGGQARSLFSELVQNAATKTKPNGGALSSIVERWISDIDHGIRTGGGNDSDVTKAIHSELAPLQEFVSGYDFSNVLVKYLEGYQTNNDELMKSALRWLRSEYSTKTEARQDLEVRSIIDDKNIYEYLKLYARFFQLAGYGGLMVNIDEMGVLSHRLNSSKARNSNYEMILRIVNDCLQGSVAGLGFIFAGTDRFLEDRRRGLFSYEALATRLADNQFAKAGLKDFSGPVIKLENLSPEDLYVLLLNIRNVFAEGDEKNHLIPDEALTIFMEHCQRTLGANYFQTPRDTVMAFVDLLSILEQNPSAKWEELINASEVKATKNPDEEYGSDSEDEMTTIQL